jgi:hypothetical protein
MGSFSAEVDEWETKACFTSSYGDAGIQNQGSSWEVAGNLLASFFSVVRGLVVQENCLSFFFLHKRVFN